MVGNILKYESVRNTYDEFARGRGLDDFKGGEPGVEGGLGYLGSESREALRPEGTLFGVNQGLLPHHVSIPISVLRVKFLSDVRLVNLRIFGFTRAKKRKKICLLNPQSRLNQWLAGEAHFSLISS